TLCSVAAASILVLAAVPLGMVYGQPQITHLVLILAITFPLGAYSTVAAPRLQVELRFRAMAMMRLLSPAVRYALVIVLAWSGAGPYSLVWPMPLVMVLELICYYVLTRSRPWRIPFS